MDGAENRSTLMCRLEMWEPEPPVTFGACPGLYRDSFSFSINLSKPTGHVMHRQFDIQQLYALPTLCVLYLSENRQRLVPLTA